MERSKEPIAKTEISAKLIVHGVWAGLEKVLSLAGIVPDSTWRKGDSIQGSAVKRQDDGFSIKSTIDVGKPLPEHINNVLQRTGPKLKRAERAPDLSIRLAVSMHIYGGDRPPFRIDARTVRELAELGAEIDVDLYTV
jgi:hypothetical protein